MDIKKLEDNAARLQKELDELKYTIAQVKTPKYGYSFDPLKESEFWNLNSTGTIDREIMRSGPTYSGKVELGSAFRTFVDADRERTRRKVLHRLRVLSSTFIPDWEDGNQPKWTFSWEHSKSHTNKVFHIKSFLSQTTTLPHFHSEEALKNALRQFTTEELATLFF